MSYGLHIIKTPAGRYTYVGTVPPALCDIVAASKSDVMGGRAYANIYGDLVTAGAFSRILATEHHAEQMARALRMHAPLAGVPVTVDPVQLPITRLSIGGAS